MQTDQLSGDQLDYWVARARGLELMQQNGNWLYHPGHNLPPRQWQPTRYWSQGGPIIEELKIDLNWDTEGTQEWSASIEPDILAGCVCAAVVRVMIVVAQTGLRAWCAVRRGPAPAANADLNIADRTVQRHQIRCGGHGETE